MYPDASQIVGKKHPEVLYLDTFPKTVWTLKDIVLDAWLVLLMMQSKIKITIRMMYHMAL